MRGVLGKPIHVSSGYGCAALNKAIGGASDSTHMRGLAADIRCPRFGSPLDVGRTIVAARIETDRIVHEFGRWPQVALAVPGLAARKQRLTIASAARGDELGLDPIG